MLTILAVAIAATQAPVAPAEAKAATSQQRFDAASAAAAEGKCEEAIPAFEAIEQTAAARKSEIVRSAVAVRKGVCLVHSDRLDDGEAAIRSALPFLASQGQEFNQDVLNARLALGRIAIRRLDYAAAAEEFKGALKLTSGNARVIPLLYLARVTTFDKSPESLAYADEALALTNADKTADKDQIASTYTIHARVLMNQGRFQDSYNDLKYALKLQGGLSLKVSLTDAVTRADLALAAMLIKKPDEARNYLAYTGAGRMADSPFATAANMETPYCGGADGLKKDDVAVVEFSLSDDGSVGTVAPIYATAGRHAALEFAQAVSRWSWTAENAKAIPLFYRLATRVEMRCSTSSGRPSVLGPLIEKYSEWAGRDMTPNAEQDGDARALPIVSASLKRSEVAGDDKGTLIALVDLGINEVAPNGDRIAYMERASEIAARIAPPEIQTLVMLQKISLTEVKRGYRVDRDALRQLLARPEVSANALSAATVRLLLASANYRSESPPDADILFNQVIADDRLAPMHPLKVNALLQLANRAAKRNDLVAAQAYFAKTGLTEQQCALIGVSPALRSSSGGSDDYPMAAVRMGFEGWVRTEFDIAADGRTIETRAIVSYPPFIFNDAAAAITKGLRFQASYRPGGGTACTANQRGVIFRLP